MNKKHGVEDLRWLIREVIREVFGEHELSAINHRKEQGNSKPGSAERILVTTSEAARILGISERTLWELKHRGELPHVAIGNGAKKESIRYVVSDLYALVAKRTAVSKRSATIAEVDGNLERAD